jgi:hypothetical protein
MGTSIDFWLFPSFLYWILEMFQQCDIIYFSFYVNLFIDSISAFKGHSSKEDDKSQKSILVPIAHRCMTAHISGLIETISIKSGGIKLVLWIQTFSLSEGMNMSGENLKLGKLMTHLQFSYILSKLKINLCLETSDSDNKLTS